MRRDDRPDEGRNRRLMRRLPPDMVLRHEGRFLSDRNIRFAIQRREKKDTYFWLGGK